MAIARRCNSEGCLIEAAKRSNKLTLDLPIANILSNPVREWKALTQGNKRIASRTINIDWSKINPDDHLFSHCSICASSNVESNGYYIKSPTDELVNSNGNAWSTPVLLSTFKTFVGAENYYEHCFSAGTRILMADGTYKDICTLKSGDFIINRKGEKDCVLNLQKRKTKSLIKLKSRSILSRDLFVTSNHPFWVFNARDLCPKTGRPNNPPIKISGNDLNNWTGFGRGVHRIKNEKIECGIKPLWKNAGELNIERDFLTHPISNKVVVDNAMNKNRAELIGWFLAEGSYTSGPHCENESGIQFSLGNNEQDVAMKISDLLVCEFGNLFRIDCKPRTYTTESGSLLLTLSNQKVAEFFKEWCGKYSWAKKLNEAAMWLPLDLQAIILKSCMDGDGSDDLKSRGYGIALKSESLIQQFLFIGWRLGLNGTYKELGVLKRYSECEEIDGFNVFTDPLTGKKSREGYSLQFTVNDSNKLNNILGIDNKKISSRSEQRHTTIFKFEEQDYILSKIQNKEEIYLEEECDVFNLEIKNDNSYIAEGVVVHNCQIPELSKGKILDAIARPVLYKGKYGGEANVFFIDILVSTDRKHNELTSRIINGELTTLSMGGIAHVVQCSKCGKELRNDETCPHIENNILDYFTDENGNERIIAELCGRSTLDQTTGFRVGDPESFNFIEASWVENPAFKGAIVNHFISNIDEEIKRTASNIYKMPSRGLEDFYADLTKMKVADVHGKTVLKLTKQELARRKREEGLISRVSIWKAGQYE